MKNLKFKVISSLIAATLIIPAAAVHAEGTTTDKSKLGSGLIKQQQHLLTVQERQQFKAAMSQKKDTIKKDHETNQALRKTITDKRSTVKTINKDIIQNHKLLSTEDLSKIQSQLNIIETDVSGLKATEAPFKQVFEQFKSDVQNKNYDAAQAQLDNVISIQNTRTSDLTKLSADLDTLISLLQTASSNATTVAPKTGA